MAYHFLPPGGLVLTTTKRLVSGKSVFDGLNATRSPSRTQESTPEANMRPLIRVSVSLSSQYTVTVRTASARVGSALTWQSIGLGMRLHTISNGVFCTSFLLKGQGQYSSGGYLAKDSLCSHRHPDVRRD